MKMGFSLPHMGSIATSENIAEAAKFDDENSFDSLWVNKKRKKENRV